MNDMKAVQPINGPRGAIVAVPRNIQLGGKEPVIFAATLTAMLIKPWSAMRKRILAAEM